MNGLTPRQRAIWVANFGAVNKLGQIGYKIVTEPVRLKYGLPSDLDHLYLYRRRHGLIDLFTISVISGAEYVGCRPAVAVRGSERIA